VRAWIKTAHDPVRDTGIGAVPELFSGSFASAGGVIADRRAMRVG
jgi:hypothetical protein